MKLTPQPRQLCLLLLSFSLACLSLVGCGTDPQVTDQPLPVPSLMPTLPITPQPPLDPAAENDIGQRDSGWIDAGPGVALRRMQVRLNQSVTPVTVVRLEPGQVRFRVGYAPDTPRALATWHDEANALVTINGGFFDEDNRSTALIVVDGNAIGSSYEGRGGMFAVDPAGNVSLRYLAEQPYDPAEQLDQVLQSWPMLIKPGSQIAYTNDDAGQPARRSVVARDTAGRVLLIACYGSDFTLRGLAEWLATSDLEIDAALNLDGGSSTGMYLDSGGQRERIDSFASLPIVLQAFR